jgi:hypothetical protein
VVGLAFQCGVSGGVLLSHEAALAVPSALKGLTSGFGMGPGVSPSLWPPKLYGDVAGLCAGRVPGTAQWTRSMLEVLSGCVPSLSAY